VRGELGRLGSNRCLICSWIKALLRDRMRTYLLEGKGAELLEGKGERARELIY
jgi:hypothetical protein